VYFNISYLLIGKQPCEKTSRLSLELEDVLNNKIALSYFSQYMESRDYWNILSLWLEIEQVPLPIQTYLHKRTLSISSSPSKLPSGADNSDTDTKGLVNKVMKIMQNYINDDAPYKVRVPDDLRAEIVESTISDNAAISLNHIKDYVIQTMKKELVYYFLYVK
jgi:hypothetical protein